MEVGVIIGRFHVDALHKGHVELVEEVFKRHKRVIIFLGCAPFGGSKKNPLDYQTRERMVKAEFPEAVILPLFDKQSNEDWSKQVDQKIQEVFPDLTMAYLYGSRGSFIPAYSGKYRTIELNHVYAEEAGTEIRKRIKDVVLDTPDFRAGIIYAREHTFPTTKMAVDIAVTKMEVIKGIGGVGEGLQPFVLLGRKPGERGLRFPGGMVDKKDESLEEAAKRELHEETGIVCEGDLKYIGSFNIKDWRVRDAEEWAIFTALFHIEHSWGKPEAADDLEEVEWVRLSTSNMLKIHPNHLPLFRALLDYMEKKNEPVEQSHSDD